MADIRLVALGRDPSGKYVPQRGFQLQNCRPLPSRPPPPHRRVVLLLALNPYEDEEEDEDESG